MKQENKTVRIQDLLFSVLYGWKGILWTVVILALLLGGVMGIRDARGLDPQVQATARQKYEDAMLQYTNSLTILEQNIENLNLALDQWQTYMESSILMAMDHRQVYEARANLYITTDYKVDPQLSLQDPDYTEAVMVQYVTGLKSGSFYQTVAQEMDMQTQYLRELVTLNQYGDSTVSVLVRHSSGETAARILEQILAYVRGLTEDISQTVCAHTLRTTAPEVALTVSADVEERQQKARSDMSADMDRLMDAWQKKEALVAPTSGEMTQSILLRNILKGAVIGGVLGGVLAVVWLLTAFLLSDKLYRGDALAARAQFPVLGSLDSGKKRGPVEKLLRKLEGREPEEPGFIGARAANCCREAVVLCGNVETEHLAAVEALLKSQGIGVIASGDALHNGAVVAALRDASGVVLLAGCGRTTYTEISRVEEVAREAGKPILAAITLD